MTSGAKLPPVKLNPEALRVIRERTGLSKAELGDRAGVDRTLITRLENGERRASVAVIVKLANALCVSQLAICSIESSDPAVPA